MNSVATFVVNVNGPSNYRNHSRSQKGLAEHNTLILQAAPGAGKALTSHSNY